MLPKIYEPQGENHGIWSHVCEIYPKSGRSEKRIRVIRRTERGWLSGKVSQHTEIGSPSIHVKAS